MKDNKCRCMKGRRERRDGKNKGIKETEDEVSEMKDARMLSLSSSTCDPFCDFSSPVSSFQLEDSLGTKDPATRMILIEYDYLPSSSDRHVLLPLPIPTLARERTLGLRVCRTADRARGNFLSDEWTDGNESSIRRTGCSI